MGRRNQTWVSRDAEPYGEKRSSPTRKRLNLLSRFMKREGKRERAGKAPLLLY